MMTTKKENGIEYLYFETARLNEMLAGCSSIEVYGVKYEVWDMNKNEMLVSTERLPMAQAVQMLAHDADISACVLTVHSCKMSRAAYDDAIAHMNDID